MEDYVLTELVREPDGEGALLHLLFVNRERLLGDVTAEGYPGHSNHKIIEFSILREIRSGNQTIKIISINISAT